MDTLRNSDIMSPENYWVPMEIILWKLVKIKIWNYQLIMYTLFWYILDILSLILVERFSIQIQWLAESHIIIMFLSFRCGSISCSQCVSHSVSQVHLSPFIKQNYDNKPQIVFKTRMVYASVQSCRFGWGLLLFRDNNKVPSYFVGFTQWICIDKNREGY